MPTIPYKNAVGKRIPGVTTVISNVGWSQDALMFWAWQQGIDGKNFRDTSSKACDAGTLGHSMVEADLLGREFDTSPFPEDLVDLAETSFLNYLQWKSHMTFEVVATEVHLVSEEHQFGATPDLIVRANGKLCLFDLKTGSGTYPNHIMQLEAYRHVWDEVNPSDPITGGFYILRIDKDTAGFDWKYRHAVPEAWEAFLLLRRLHDLKKLIK